MADTPDTPDPEDWHGHRIVTEDDLAEGFSDDDPDHVDNPRYYRRRLLHGIVLGLLAAVLIAALVFAYLVKTRQIVIPALEPQPAPAAAPAHDPVAAACPQDVLDHVAPKDVTVNVLNGTKTPGLAGATAQVLKQRGFRVGDVGNAKLNDPDIVGAVVSGTSGRAKALTVQRHIPGTEYVAQDKRSADTVDFIIGTKYDIQKVRPAGKANTAPGKLSCPIAVKAARAEVKKSAAASESARSASAPATDDGGK